MINLIFMAPPSAGKGTQSKFLEKDYGYTHISTGDLLRESASNGSALGEKIEKIISSGSLISDDIMLSLLEEKLVLLNGKSFILDGFPRTLNQVKLLEDLFDKYNILDYKVIYLDLSKEEALKRALGRIICSCGKSYNIDLPELRPKVDGICDICGKPLVKRSDDDIVKYEERFNNYLNSTIPVIDYYKSNNKLYSVDASISPTVTYSQIKEIICD